ncbi:MAG: CHRD domain-containing protein [Chitinophagaceae bacterium]
MKTFKLFFLPALAVSLFLSSCKDLDIFNNVISRKGLPVNGLQEVPVRIVKAYGHMDVWYNKKTKLLTYEVTWSLLTGNPIGSHIHGEAPPGVNAGIKHDFTSLIPKVTSGTFKNSVTVDEVAIKEAGLLAGLYYVNIHTPTFPGGEIRGQIEF